MKLVVFEDAQFERFLPLAWVRGVFELRCGATTLADKLARVAGARPAAYFTREYLAPVLRKRLGAPINDLAGASGGEVLFLNARLRTAGLKLPVEPGAYWTGDQLAVWRTTDDVRGIRDYAGLVASAQRAPRREFAGKWFEYIWDVMLANPEEITADFEAAGAHGLYGRLHESAVVYGPRERLLLADGAEVQPLVCIDTRHGPVTIEKGCEIHPFTRIEGPCYIGPGTILLGAKVREGCSFGPMCRVGGEVEESILHGHSNKYHDGFLGHAYVGEWANLGALTTNSDLKNDYSSVSVIQNGRPVDTQSTKVGSFIADHVKTSIGTLLNTGSVAGTMAVLVATGEPLPKYIPPFAWMLNGMISKGFGLNPLIDTARIAMSRRKVELSAEEEALLRHVHDLTAPDREAYVRRARQALATRL